MPSTVIRVIVGLVIPTQGGLHVGILVFHLSEFAGKLADIFLKNGAGQGYSK